MLTFSYCLFCLFVYLKVLNALNHSTDRFYCVIGLGNIYKMSRNKDRYESSNNRRQQIFMSQEDVAAGRKSNWTGVEITGN